MVVDSSIQAKPGIEITVRLQDGKTVALAQVADERFMVGDEVKVLTSKEGKARVTH
jgi:outer membrane lipoprotein SlyB